MDRNDFADTSYARHWQQLLSSARLHQLAQQHGYRLVFYPHIKVTPYLSTMRLLPTVDVITHGHRSIQDILGQAAVLITDYSSIAFDVAFMRRAVLYYQFDRDEFFSGAHTYSKGYFDYERDGFGPCCVEQAHVIDELALLLNRDAAPEWRYLERMQRFFAFHDARNCERVANALVDVLSTSPTQPVGRCPVGR
jgi:CDP-glycerol glycerophosphotransferase (TagB/SpsB family)